jgi:hypothetical protein
MPSADGTQRFRLNGIIIAMYSPQMGPPARMYMLIADKDGVAGVTVWGDTVLQLMDSNDVVGQAVSIPGCSLSLYNGKRGVNVPRNHTIAFPSVSPHSGGSQNCKKNPLPHKKCNLCPSTLLPTSSQYASRSDEKRKRSVSMRANNTYLP